jgi:hypothetical protein
MPLTPSGNYEPQSVSGYFPQDLYNLGAGPAKTPQATLKAKYFTKVIQKTDEGQVIHWRVIVEDTRGGANLTFGQFDQDFDRVASSSLDTRYYRTLILPQKSTNYGTGPAAGYYGVHNVNAFGFLHVGVGSTANASFFKETSLSDPTLGAITYSPASAIVSMSNVAVGSGRANARIAIGHLSNVVQLLDSAYTATPMHADTAACFGIIQTFLNNNQLLIYSGNAIRYLDSTVAVATQPTVGITNVPNGGYAVGILQLAGTPARAYWVWPKTDATYPLLQGNQSPGRLVSTNLEGTDWQEIPLDMDNVYYVAAVGSSAVVASDRNRIVYYDGRSRPRDINWLVDRTITSGYVIECRGLGCNGSEILIEVNYYAPNDTSLQYYRWTEVYNLESNALHIVTPARAIGTPTSNSGMRTIPMASIPLSSGSGFSQVVRLDNGTNSASFERVFIPVYGYNPFTLYKQTTDGGSGTGNEYESEGSVYWPSFELAGLEGWPKMVTRIIAMGDIDAGGTAATAATQTITAGNLTATFGTGLSGRSQLQDLVDSGDVFYRLSMSTVLTRTTASTRFTPNGLPFMVEGYCWVEDIDPPFGWESDGR